MLCNVLHGKSLLFGTVRTVMVFELGKKNASYLGYLRTRDWGGHFDIQMADCLDRKISRENGWIGCIQHHVKSPDILSHLI